MFLPEKSNRPRTATKLLLFFTVIDPATTSGHADDIIGIMLHTVWRKAITDDSHVFEDIIITGCTYTSIFLSKRTEGGGDHETRTVVCTHANTHTHTHSHGDGHAIIRQILFKIM